MDDQPLGLTGIKLAVVPVVGLVVSWLNPG